MSDWHRFGEDRHLPPGEWVKTTTVIKVAGIHHRKSAAGSFANTVAKAEEHGLFYGVRLEPEPTNEHDRNAIKVIGVADRKKFFGGAKRTEWHVGYLPKEDAADLTDNLVCKGIEIAAELYRIFVRDDHVGIQIIVLAPPGHSHSARVRRKKQT